MSIASNTFIKFSSLFLTLSLCFGANLKAEEIAKNQWIPQKDETETTSMQAEIDWLNHVICRYYLPQLRKKERHQFSWADEVRKAKKAIQPSTTYSQYLGILKQLVLSLRDQHIDLFFYAPGNVKKKSIPIIFYTIDNRLFVKSIHSSVYFKLKINDEITEIAGKPAIDYFKEMGQIFLHPWLNQKCPNLIAHSLLFRSAERGHELPEGLLTIKARDHKTGEIKVVKAHWEIGHDSLPGLYNDKTAPSLKLGELENHNSTGIFETKWYGRSNDKAKIGYLKIKTFSPQDQGPICGVCKSIGEFEQLIKQFEQTTDLLIVDLRNNFGGLKNLCHALTSYLTPKPLEMYKKASLLDQVMIDGYRSNLLLINRWLDEGITSPYNSFKSVDRYHTAHMYGISPLTRTYLIDLKGYLQGLLAQWGEGKRMSNWQYESKFLPPNPKVTYTKPLIVLVNEITASSSEIMTALLKDNQRATVFGKTTAGAGCYINTGFHNMPMKGPYAISSINFSSAMILRSNGQLIEDQGIEPDVICDLTSNDYLNNGVDYSKKLNEVVDKLLKEQDGIAQ